LSINAGTRLGPYEILSPLGAGGMGEVWRARDTRLGRDVAIKVLPEELASDRERLKRFEREAHAASALSHPNIVTIYEVAREDATAFIAMELIAGKTLRNVIGGTPLPLRRILAIAPQIAEGLARAHASGIVHRDLKPENVMVTEDGHVKILDFGLAKLTHPELDSAESREAPTVSAGTKPDIVMGTVGYMSPEQASGHPIDYRSDQFSLGSVLYEMTTGSPAFKRPTTAQTLAAIIQDDPEPIGAKAPRTPAPLRWAIQRCLAKEAKGRYASTEDLARELADLRDHVSELSVSAGISVEEPPRRRRWGLIAAAVGLAALIFGAYRLGGRAEAARQSHPTFRQLTFRGLGIGTARFTPDGQSIVFSTQTEGKPPELMVMRLDSPEARSLGLPPAQILSISSEGEMALLLLHPYALSARVGHAAFEQVVNRDPRIFDGTLATASLSGGAPTEILEDVSFADWGPEGKLAIVRRVGIGSRVEYPIGKVIDDREDTLFNHPRVSPAGRLIYKDWDQLRLDGPGTILKDYAGGAFESAWSGPGDAVWYNIARPETEIHAITPSGRDRLVLNVPGDFILYDIARDGRVLLGRLVETTEILGTFPDAPRERNLSYFDLSVANDLSPSGDVLLFGDIFRPEWASSPSGFFVRKTDGSPPKLLRAGGIVISPDGKWTLGSWVREGMQGPNEGLSIAPIGPGEDRRLPLGKVGYDWIEGRAGFFPDGKRVFFCGTDGDQPHRVWVTDVEGGAPRAVTPPFTRRPVLLGDGRFLCARAADAWNLYSVDATDTAPQKVVGILPGEEPFRATPDGKWLYVRGADELRPGETLMTTRVYRLDPRNGQRELWKEIPAHDSRTGGTVSTILFSADGRTCVWTHIRYSTELVLVEGLK
jgi:hypothetical protein